MSISERALLALPNISVWSARRFDRQVSEKVAEDHNTKSARRAGRYNKCLIDVESPLYTRIKKIEGEARRYHEAHTLPWAQDGARILPGPMYFEYCAKMAEFQALFQHAVKQFLEAYPDMVEQARTDLNGMFRDADYPTQGELEGKFSMRMSFYPVPETKDDFRIETLGEEEISKLRAAIEEEVKQATQTASMARWERLLDVVSAAVERLSDPDKVFRDSLIGNIKDAVQTLPKLALEKDKEFDTVINEVKKHLAGASPKYLREDPTARKAAAKRAQEIVDKMSQFMAR